MRDLNIPEGWVDAHQSQAVAARLGCQTVRTQWIEAGRRIGHHGRLAVAGELLVEVCALQERFEPRTR